jgi:hypothetical protein
MALFDKTFFSFPFLFSFQNKNINKQPKKLKTIFPFMSHQNTFSNKKQKASSKKRQQT